MGDDRFYTRFRVPRLTTEADPASRRLIARGFANPMRSSLRCSGGKCPALVDVAGCRSTGRRPCPFIFLRCEVFGEYSAAGVSEKIALGHGTGLLHDEADCRVCARRVQTIRATTKCLRSASHCGSCAQACLSKLSCAVRLNASAATVLSKRGATTTHGHWEQHQPVMSSSSAQIMRLVIGTPCFVDFGGTKGFRTRLEQLHIGV